MTDVLPHRVWQDVKGANLGRKLANYSQANEHHRAHLKSLPSTSYPLEPLNDPAEVPENQRVSDEPFGQR